MENINNGVIMVLTDDPRLGPMLIEKSGLSEFANQPGFRSSMVWHGKRNCFRIDLKNIEGTLDFCMWDFTDLCVILGVPCCVGVSFAMTGLRAGTA